MKQVAPLYGDFLTMCWWEAFCSYFLLLTFGQSTDVCPGRWSSTLMKRLLLICRELPIVSYQHPSWTLKLTFYEDVIPDTIWRYRWFHVKQARDDRDQTLPQSLTIGEHSWGQYITLVEFSNSWAACGILSTLNMWCNKFDSLICSFGL